MRTLFRRRRRLHRQRPPLAPAIRSTRTRLLALRLRVLPSFLLPRVVKVLFQGLIRSFLPRQFAQVSITFIAAAPSVWLRLSLQVQPYVTLSIGSGIFSTFYFLLSSRSYSTPFLYSVFDSPPSPSINSSPYGSSVDNIHLISPSFGLLLHLATYSCTTLHHLRCIATYVFRSLFPYFEVTTPGIIGTPTTLFISFNRMLALLVSLRRSIKYSGSGLQLNSTHHPRRRTSRPISNMAIIP